MHLIKIPDPTPTPAEPPAPAPLPAFLSIAELTRYLGGVERTHDTIDATGIRTKADSSEAMTLLFHRAEALRDLIVTMPARTLADAACQIMVAQHYACDVASNEMEADEYQRLGGILWRVTLSVLPAIAEAAGIDMAAEGWSCAISLRKHQLGTVEALS